jgi:hypothetical protein
VSDRVSTTISTSPSAPAPAGPRAGRFFIVGQTGQGPATAPTVIRSMAQYEQVYGSRSGGAAMYDAAQLALRSGASEVVVQRATGPTPVKATISLDSGKIVVTAKDPGAHANGWTAAWNSGTTTLTIVAGSVTETYVGAPAAALIAAAAASGRVTVTSSGTLPSSNVTATALASGADDFANVSWATMLALLSPDLGSGCVAIPGVAHGTVGTVLAAHCASSRRHGLVTAAAGASVATLVSAAATVRGYANSEFLDLVGPWVVVPDGAGGSKTVDPAAFAAGLRAAAIRVSPGESAAAEVYARGVVDVAPEYQVNSDDWASLHTARVSVIRSVGAYTRLYSYQMVAAPGNNANLIGGQYRDLINAITVDAETILESAFGAPASPGRLAALAGELAAMLAPYSGTYLVPRSASNGSLIDPGYRVEVTTGAQPADNRISAVISLRLTESIDFVDLVVAVGDATVSL